MSLPTATSPCCNHNPTLAWASAQAAGFWLALGSAPVEPHGDVTNATPRLGYAVSPVHDWMDSGGRLSGPADSTHQEGTPMADRRFTTRKETGAAWVAYTSDNGQRAFAELGPRVVMALAEEAGPHAARFIRIRAMVATSGRPQ